MKRIYDVDIIVDNKNIFIEVFGSLLDKETNTIEGCVTVTTFENNIALQSKNISFTCTADHGKDSVIAAGFSDLEKLLSKKNNATKEIKKAIHNFYDFFNENYPDDFIFYWKV